MCERDTIEMLKRTRRTRTVAGGRRRRGLSQSLALGAALLAVSGRGGAQTVLTERLRLQGGYLTEQRASPAPRMEDVWASAIPQLNLMIMRPKAVFSVTYQLTAGLHSFAGMSELANWLSLTGDFDLSPRTRLLLSAEATQSTLANYLLTQPPGTVSVGLYPAAANRFLNARVSQGILHELTPRVRVEQTADASAFTTLAPTPPLESFVANLGGGIERTMSPQDAVGAELRAGFGAVRATPPTPDQQFGTLTAGPRWRRDWTASLSSLVAGGATAVVALNRAEAPIVGPYVRASLLYTWEPRTIEAVYTTGITPSILTGQLVRNHAGLLRATTPLSEHHRITLQGSVGYQWADLVDMRNQGNDLRFEAMLAEVEVAWQASPFVQLFSRYQFMAQLGETNARGVNPSFLRDFFLVGVQLSSRPAGAQQAVQSGFPQRVDRADDRRRRTEDQQREEQQDDRESGREAPERAGAPESGPAPQRAPGAQPGVTPQRGPARWIYTTPAAPPVEERR
jgi:hypothetical protein